MLLFQRLRNEAERKTSTPAMRLLDDLLVIMDADTGSSQAARLESAAERMDMAFDPNGGVFCCVFYAYLAIFWVFFCWCAVLALRSKCRCCSAVQGIELPSF